MDRLSRLLEVDTVTAVRLGLIWVLAWLALQAVKLVARRIVKVATAGEQASLHQQRAQTIAQLLRSAGLVVILVLAAFESLETLQVNITPFLASVGVLGLAVSFGAQSLVKDYFGGFFILLENQFAVGDSVDVAGKSGTVERMTLRIVMLRDLDGTLHIIPNGQITTVSNKTRGWSRAVVDVGISYDSDLDTAIGVLKSEAAAFGNDPAWSASFDAAPEVTGVEAFGDNGVTVRVLLRTRPGLQWGVAREFRRRVTIRLEREGIEGARPRQTINIHQLPPAGGA